MKQQLLKFCLVAACGIGAMAPTLAGDDGPPPAPASTVTNLFSLEALVLEALEKNPELRFYEAEIQAAKAGRRTAGLPPNPEVSGSVGRKTARDSNLSAEGVAWSASLVQPFEWPGRIGLRKAIANRDVELADLGLQRFQAALAARVRVLAFDFFAAQEKAAAAREVADRLKALREALVQRDPSGLTPLLETRVIEATELTMQRKASEAEIATHRALLELNQLRGVSPESRLSVARSRLAFRPPEAPETLVTLARTNNFELRLRAVELAQQGFRVELAKNERFPTISIGPTFGEEKGLDHERTIGIGVSVPVPLWNRNQGNIEAAVARQVQAEVSLSVAEREVQRKVLQAARTYETKLREIAGWRPEAVQHFRDAAALADRHYRLGAVPLSTYVELQKQYLEAVESLVDTQAEALKAAQELELLTGMSQPLAKTSEEEKQ